MVLAVEDEIIEGVQGGKIEFEIALVDENNRPVDTTVYDEYKVCIKIDSSTTLEVTQAIGTNGSQMTRVGDATFGVFKVSITPTDSLSLPDKDRQDIQVQLKESGTPANTLRFQIKDRLSVEKALCS